MTATYPRNVSGRASNSGEVRKPTAAPSRSLVLVMDRTQVSTSAVPGVRPKDLCVRTCHHRPDLGGIRPVRHQALELPGWDEPGRGHVDARLPGHARPGRQSIGIGCPRQERLIEDRGQATQRHRARRPELRRIEGRLADIAESRRVTGAAEITVHDSILSGPAAGPGHSDRTQRRRSWTPPAERLRHAYARPDQPIPRIHDGRSDALENGHQLTTSAEGGACFRIAKVPAT